MNDSEWCRRIRSAVLTAACCAARADTQPEKDKAFCDLLVSWLGAEVKRGGAGIDKKQKQQFSAISHGLGRGEE